jgi:hypothetical protein
VIANYRKQQSIGIRLALRVHRANQGLKVNKDPKVTRAIQVQPDLKARRVSEGLRDIQALTA